LSRPLPTLRKQRPGPLAPEELGQIYGGMAERYEAQAITSPINHHAFGHLIDEIARALPREARLIEIGSGPGTLAVELAKRGVRVLAADISEGMLEQTEIAAARAGVEVPVQWIDATKDLSMLGTFDALLTVNGPLTFNRDGIAMMARFSRILRPGGPIWLALPRAAALEQLRRRPLRGLVPLLFPGREYAMSLALEGRDTEVYIRDPLAFARALEPYLELREIRATGLSLRLPDDVDRKLGTLPLLRRLGAFSIIHGTAKRAAVEEPARSRPAG
jgi:SAM-dependent methyltransferase